jgi:hypothetical protein
MTLWGVADCDDFSAAFLALVDEAFRHLLDQPDAHLHVTGFAEGAGVRAEPGRSELRRRAEVYGSESQPSSAVPAAQACDHPSCLGCGRSPIPAGLQHGSVPSARRGEH